MKYYVYLCELAFYTLYKTCDTQAEAEETVATFQGVGSSATWSPGPIIFANYFEED